MAFAAPAQAQIVNGTFNDGGAGWTNVIQGNGSVSFAANTARVTGNDGGGTNLTVTTQQMVSTGTTLEFDLLSYTSTDVGSFDYPVFFLDGQLFGLNTDGTLGVATTGGTGGAGTIRNSNQVNSTIHFSIPIPPGPHTVGFGVLSTDGIIGAGIATFDNVTTTGTTETAQTIQNFLNQRNNNLLTYGPSLDRRISRLLKSATSSSPNGNTTALFTQSGNQITSSPTSRLANHHAESGHMGSNRSALSGPSALTGAVQRLGFTDQDDTEQSRRSSALPLGLTVNGDRGERTSFSTSLSQIALAAAETKRAKLGGGGDTLQKLGVSGAAVVAPKHYDVDVWAEGHIVHFDTGPENAENKGDFAILYMGADYVLAPNILIGALVQFDKMDSRSQNLNSKISGHGWMIGPYATVRLGENVFTQARAAWGKSDNQVSPFLTYTDDFDTTRWLVQGSLQGRWQHGSWIFSPHASVSYIEEDQEAYTDTLGNLIPSQTVSLGQSRIGPKVSYFLQTQDGTTVEPYAEIEAIWNFDESSSSVVAANLAGNGDNDIRGRAGIGVTATAASGVSIGLSGHYDGIGVGDLEAVSGEVKLSVPLN